MIRKLAAHVLGAVLLAGCASTQEIETAPPQARSSSEPGAAAASEAPLLVVLTEGDTMLPPDVSHLRFRIVEIRLHRTDGRWVRLPSDSAPVELSRDLRTARRTLLDTRVAPVVYDSITVAFENVFVQFGPNAGAPLTMSTDVPQQLAITLDPSPGTLTSVELLVEAGASLTRSPDCRWFFVPVLRGVVSSRPLAPAGAVDG